MLNIPKYDNDSKYKRFLPLFYRYDSLRPALSLAIWPLFDENAAYVMKNIPRKHLEEMTIFSSRICQQPPNFKW